MPAHTPRDAVVEAANRARDAGADLIVTFGRAPVTPPAKVMPICPRPDIRPLDGPAPLPPPVEATRPPPHPLSPGPHARPLPPPPPPPGPPPRTTAPRPPPPP